MEALVHVLMVVLILANLRLLGGTRLPVCIMTVAAQGAALGLLPLMLHPSGITQHALVVAVAAVVLKGGLFPWLLKRALRQAGVQREVAPYVGFTPSMLFGVLALGLGALLARKLPLPAPDVSPLLVPVALATMMTGLFLIIARRQALMQVVGYLALENGIFAFGAVVMKHAPLLVEMGILLDIFVAVFVMGIMVFHISREFDHTDTERLSELKDWDAMMLCLLLFGVPALAGLLMFTLRNATARRALLVLAALAHAGLMGWAWIARPAVALDAWLGLDATALWFLTITSVLFLTASVYAIGYLRRDAATRSHEDEDDPEDDSFFQPVPEAVFCGCLLLFLAAMTLTIMSRHFGLLWVAMEATTLASAPLIYFHRTPRSLEATWKYLLICSVGIALALLGIFFLAAAAGEGVELTLGGLTRGVAKLDPRWLKAAALLLLVGFGTKMGLAPMHAWLPDAHSEAPSVVSALLSGTLLNAAWVGVLRIHQLCVAAGLGDFSRDLLLFFGLLSLAIAALFIIGQRDYKRLLAYSSVEHMGLLALGMGIGGAAVTGSLLHAAGHSLAKGLLFLTAGNLLAAFRSKKVADVRGALSVTPASGALLLVGLFAITGAPPFITFVSELMMVRAAVADGRWLVATLYLVLLAVVFIGMAAIFLRMALGAPSKAVRKTESRLAWWPPLVLAVLAGVLGLYLPGPLTALLREAAATFGGMP